MSFANIQLPEIVVVDLFKKSLVYIPDEAIQTEKISVPYSEKTASSGAISSLQPETTTTSEAIPVLAPGVTTSPQAASVQQPEEYAAYMQQPPQNTQPAAISIQHSAETLQYLGKNLKNITLLVHYPEHAYMPEEHLNFLTNILKACQLNMGDIAIVNNATRQTDLHTLTAVLQPKQLLLFGSFRNIMSDVTPFIIKDIQGIKILTAPELGDLDSGTAESKQLKGKLWNCLKQLFNV